MAEAATIDVKRYDRQIRLWGLDTQRGLLGARILLLEFTGTGNEILKNLVLAGVGHVCIQDAATISAADVEAGGIFSLSAAQIGMNRAEAAVQQLQPMNPQACPLARYPSRAPSRGWEHRRRTAGGGRHGAVARPRSSCAQPRPFRARRR